MELTLHSACFIVEFVSNNTEIFWTKLSCWHKRYTNKVTILLGWSIRYNTFTVVIKNWLSVTKYHFFMQKIIINRSFFSFMYVFFHLSPTRLFPKCTKWVTRRVRYTLIKFLVFVLHFYFSLFDFVLCLMFIVVSFIIKYFFDFLYRLLVGNKHDYTHEHRDSPLFYGGECVVHRFNFLCFVLHSMSCT